MGKEDTCNSNQIGVPPSKVIRASDNDTKFQVNIPKICTICCVPDGDPIDNMKYE